MIWAPPGLFGAARLEFGTRNGEFGARGVTEPGEGARGQSGTPGVPFGAQGGRGGRPGAAIWGDLGQVGATGLHFGAKCMDLGGFGAPDLGGSCEVPAGMQPHHPHPHPKTSPTPLGAPQEPPHNPHSPTTAPVPKITIFYTKKKTHFEGVQRKKGTRRTKGGPAKGGGVTRSSGGRSAGPCRRSTASWRPAGGGTGGVMSGGTQLRGRGQPPGGWGGGCGLTSALALCDWKKTASLCPHLGGERGRGGGGGVDKGGAWSSPPPGGNGAMGWVGTRGDTAEPWGPPPRPSH